MWELELESKILISTLRSVRGTVSVFGRSQLGVTETKPASAG